MSEFVYTHQDEDQASVYFNVEDEEVLAIGEEMEAINEEAYMNGYNWEALLGAYLQQHNPALLDGMETDSEAGTFVALYEPEDGEKANQLVALIEELIANPEKLYSFLKENGEHIDWD